MKSINIADEEKRDAIVGVDRLSPVAPVIYVEATGRPIRPVRFIKSTRETAWRALREKKPDPAAMARWLAAEDPEIDYTLTGKRLEQTRRVFLKPDGSVAYTLKWQEILYDPEGRETGRREYIDREANISGEIPLRWTGRFITKREGTRAFVTRRVYQLKHVNGLTYDFLYRMAERLQRKNALLVLGAGRDGTEPLVLVRGGLYYRAFLEGRVRGADYMLLLRLSNLELKEAP